MKKDKKPMLEKSLINNCESVETKTEEINATITNNKDIQVSKWTDGNSKLKSDLQNKRKQLDENRLGLEKKSEDVKNLLVKVEEAENENFNQLKKIDQMDLKLSELETLMEKIKYEKAEAQRKVQSNEEKIAKLSEKKMRLDKFIDKEVQERTEIARILEAEINLLEEKIANNRQLSDKREKETISIPDLKRDLLKFLIEKKEKELECPVCLVPATVPIFSCPERHLICSSCRPKVTACPECRVEYKDKSQHKRHRYAERMAEELNKKLA